MHAESITQPSMWPVVAIAAPCGAGARDPGCQDGPAAFRWHWDQRANSSNRALIWDSTPDGLGQQGSSPFDVVVRTNQWLAATTRRVAERGRRFLVIGGDHSCAVGTWSGASEALQEIGPLGLIWIDAHMDMHVPETSHSGAINGMPLAALLGHGSPELTGLANGRRALEPRHVCLVGARSFEPEEVEFARRHGLRVIDMNELSRRGIVDSLAEARAIARDNTIGYGLSLDLDAFDPAEAPGVGTPAPGGIHANDFLETWIDLTGDPACRGMEIVEYNPHRDQQGRTLRLMETFVAAAIQEERMQWAG